MSDISVKNVNDEIKLKASFVLKCKGKSLTQAIKEFLEEQAKEFDKMRGN